MSWGGVCVVNGKDLQDVFAAVAEAKKQEREHVDALIAALGAILDAADYTSGACRPTEMVGAVLPVELIGRARAAIAKAD